MKKKDTQLTVTATTLKATEADTTTTKSNNNCNWDNSQLSGLLFSSSPPPPHPPNKMIKIEKDEVNAQMKTLNEPEPEPESDSGFDDYDLLRELDSDEWDNPMEIENSLSLNDKNIKPLTSTSLAFCSNKNDHDNFDEIVYSAADSIYDTISSTPDIKSTMMMPMIDISTPIAHFTSQKFGKSPMTLPSQLRTNTKNITDWIVMLPESFTKETLQHNILKIDPSLHLNPIAAIKNSNDRRIKFPVALMIRDFRGMGGMIQVRLVDGNGNEMGGSLPFSACSDLGIKLHFGLVLVVNEVNNNNNNFKHLFIYLFIFRFQCSHRFLV